MNDRYILRGHQAVQEPDLMTWAKWFETANRTVRRTESGGIMVSTVFLGLNHSFGNERPTLFETMIFGGDHNDHQERCSTWDEAVAMHERAVALAFHESDLADGGTA